MELLLQHIDQMSGLEAAAAGAGVVSVLFLQAGRIWGYPIGMISVGTYVWICFEARLYAHAGVNAYYFFMNIYGWYHWLKGEEGRAARYGYCKRWEQLTTLFGVVVCFGGLYYVLSMTDSEVAAWDALTTAIWIAAMWLLARKRIENWVCWIVADIICIPLYFQIGLPLTGLQMLTFLCIATLGLIRWKRAYRAQELRKNRAD